MKKAVYFTLLVALLEQVVDSGAMNNCPRGFGNIARDYRDQHASVFRTMQEYQEQNALPIELTSAYCRSIGSVPLVPDAKSRGIIISEKSDDSDDTEPVSSDQSKDKK